MKKSRSVYCDVENSIQERSYSNSAAAAEAERQIKTLTEENACLKDELQQLQALYKQLLTENVKENFSEKRVLFLKAQLIQAERQLLLFSEALNGRAEMLVTVENVLSDGIDLTRRLMQAESRLGEFVIGRDDMNTIVGCLETARQHLLRHEQVINNEKLSQPIRVLSDLRGHRVTSDPVTWLDVCRGGHNILNLRYVSQLESQLAEMFGELTSLRQSLSILQASIATSSPISSSQLAGVRHLPAAVTRDVETRLTRCCSLLPDVCSNLLTLTLLVPSAPWPPLKKAFQVHEVTVDKVMGKLRRSKSTAESEQLIGSLVTALNYVSHMRALQEAATDEVLHLHGAVYQTQLDYTQSLLQALSNGYTALDENLQQNIVQPLSEVLEVLSHVQVSSNVDHIHRLVSDNRPIIEQLRQQLLTLKYADRQGGEEVLCEFSQLMRQSVAAIETECARRRDRLIAEQLTLTGRHEELCELLRHACTAADDTTPVTDTPAPRAVDMTGDRRRSFPVKAVSTTSANVSASAVPVLTKPTSKVQSKQSISTSGKVSAASNSTKKKL